MMWKRRKAAQAQNGSSYRSVRRQRARLGDKRPTLYRDWTRICRCGQTESASKAEQRDRDEIVTDGKISVVQLAKAKDATDDGEVPAPGKRPQENK
jgi:hypothetical protein